jgi:hypothetical protein
MTDIDGVAGVDDFKAIHFSGGGTQNITVFVGSVGRAVSLFC